MKNNYQKNPMTGHHHQLYFKQEKPQELLKKCGTLEPETLTETRICEVEEQSAEEVEDH